MLITPFAEQNTFAHRVPQQLSDGGIGLICYSASGITLHFRCWQFRVYRIFFVPASLRELLDI